MHSSAYGKGPSRARTHLHDGSYVLCMLRDPFTVSERTLISAGRVDVVEASRSAFYETAEPSLRDIVERLTGYTVVSFLANVATDIDLITHLFVLDAKA